MGAAWPAEPPERPVVSPPLKPESRTPPGRLHELRDAAIVRSDAGGSRRISASVTSGHPAWQRRERRARGRSPHPVCALLIFRNPAMTLPYFASSSRNAGTPPASRAARDRRRGCRPAAARRGSDGLPPEAPSDERGDRFVGRRRGRPQTGSAPSAVAEPRERLVVTNGIQRVGMPSTEAPAAPEGAARGRRRCPTKLREEDERREAQLAAEIDGGWLLGEERVRAGVDRVTAHVLGPHDPPPNRIPRSRARRGCRGCS